jgi:chromosome partitioning protein
MATDIRVVAVICEKGGVGKTTVSLDLAVTASQKGRTVAVIDIDQQATASKWTDRRSSDTPWVVPTHSTRIAATIEKAKSQGVDFIVIDTPPHSATDAAEAARRADVVIAPIEPHLFALETVPKLADLLKLAGDPPAFFVINKAPTQGTEGQSAVDYIKGQGLTVCPVMLHLRADHRHAANVGKVAGEYKGGSKAAQETLHLYTYTMQFIDKQRKPHAETQSAHARA